MNRPPRYVATWNQPEMEPMQFSTFDEAKRAIIEELKAAEDRAENETEAEEFCSLAEEVNLESQPFSVAGPDGYAYSVEAE